MSDDQSDAVGATAFLLPHQDDEIAVFAEIERTLSAGFPAYCIFLTNGRLRKHSVAIRMAESRSVLTALGVPDQHISFVGVELDLPDGALVEHLERAYTALGDIVKSLGKIDRIFFPAWEGGNEDHDAVHLLGLALAKRLQLLSRAYQVPYYRAGAWAPFALFAPLDQNGPPIDRPIALRDRLRYVRYTFRYHSQARVIAVMLPFMITHYLWRGTQRVQRADPRRVTARPHQGTLLYERRDRYHFEKLSLLAAPFIEQHICADWSRSQTPIAGSSRDE